MRPTAWAIAASVCLATLVAVASVQAQRLAEPRSASGVAGAQALPGPATPKGRLNELLGSWKAAANESERSKVEKELREVLKGEFQARLGAHEKEIAQLEAKVKRLREQLELRRKKQDDIVDFRVQQLLREAQGLGWGTEPVTTSGVFYSGSRSTVDTTKSGTTSGVFGSVRASSR